ncbi:MAG: RnfABCDGE type electron transport complex subunit G [Oscillospiraceae bacterium]|jgi:electron transport complex protein RnfG|nr:RnfABCDGE type electron transport complex subunit G [Oscillospiraceae bacterium]
MPKPKKITPKAILVPALSLLMISMLCAAALALVNSITKTRIADNARKTADQAREAIFPAAQFTKKSIGGKSYYVAAANGEALGYVMECSAQGYGGTVTLAVGIGADGAVRKLQVLAMADETPGLGQNIAEADFLERFFGKNGKLALKIDGGEMDAVTSATYSSRAAVAAVNEALEIYASIREGGSAA